MTPCVSLWPFSVITYRLKFWALCKRDVKGQIIPDIFRSAAQVPIDLQNRKYCEYILCAKTEGVNSPGNARTDMDILGVLGNQPQS